MPRVPSAERYVFTTPLPNVRIHAQYSPDAFGAAIGRGLMDFARSIAEVEQQEKRKADQMAALAAERALGEFEVKLFWGSQTGLGR